MIRRMSILPLLVLAMALLFVAGAEAQLNSADRTALLSIRAVWTPLQSGNGAWTTSSVDSACSTWRGVQCEDESASNTTRVSSIVVESEQLTGVLPAALFNLPRLVNLSLSDNAITGSILTNWDLLPNLVSLKLSRNNLTGSVPVQIGTYLTNLETLALDGNDLDGLLPESLKNLASLSFLNVSCNEQLSGALFAWLPSFTELRVLSAAYTKMLGVMEAPLAGWNVPALPAVPFSNPQLFLFSQNTTACVNLTVLDVRGVNVVGARLPGTLGAMNALEEFRWSCTFNAQGGDFPNITSLATNLRILDGSFEGCDLEIPESLGNATSLEFLRLTKGGASEYSEIVKIPETIGNLVHLTHLDLSYNSLSGTLPASMVKLVALEHLDLRVNKLSGSLPASHLHAWTQMQTLNLLSNNLNGALPDAFDLMTKLQALILDGNQFSGNFPATITMCQELISLSMTECAIQGAIPASIANLKKLLYLTLGANAFNHLPDELSQLESLKLIALDGNQLNGTFPAPLTRLSNLTTLVLPGSGLTGPLPDLGHMTSLETLVLSDNMFEGGIPDSWQPLASSLKDLQLINANLNGTIPSWLGSFTKLTFLAVRDNGLTGTIPEALTGMSSLRNLDLCRNQLSGTIPAVFGSSHFETIDFSYNQLNGTLPLTFNDPTGVSPLLGLYLMGNHLSFCPSNITRLARMVALTHACDISGQIDMPYDCGCQYDAFVNCTSKPQPLTVCIPCQGPPPNAEYPFECQAGVWVLISKNGTLTGGGITVGGSPVTIPGNLTVTTITYQGLPSGSVNVGGCADVQSITLNLTQEDLNRLAALSPEERRKELLSMGTCEAKPVPIIIVSPNTDKCKTVTATPTTDHGTLGALFTISDKCKGVKWWAILVGVLLGALLVVAAIGLAWYLIRRNNDKKARSTFRSRSSVEVPTH